MSRKYGYESGSTWSMTGPPTIRERQHGVQWYRLTPWDEVEWGTWIKFHPRGPLFMKVNSNVISLRNGRTHDPSRDYWVGDLKIVVVSDDRNSQYALRFQDKVMVPIPESQVPADLRQNRENSGI